MGSLFSVCDTSPSHSVVFDLASLKFATDAEPAGQLLLCLTGELALYGHAGEWVIPADHMVFIPPARMFRLEAHVPSSGVVAKFCRNEVTWAHDGCWVGPINDIAIYMARYSLKWSAAGERQKREARSFFEAMGEMVPGWFRHERIMWTPYTENTAIRRVIEYVRFRGPGISLPEAARHAGMSERTLRRHMKSELGQGWREFIRELRMNTAMDLLRKKRKSVTETAFAVGFSSSSAFSKAFQEYVGKTPSKFVRKSRN